MPPRLRRYYGCDYLHFITTSCYHRQPLLSPERRDLFLQVLEQVRRRYHFAVVGYVVMPEHVHLLLGEPERYDPSVVMQVLKQSFARMVQRLDGGSESPLWQRRFYDFVVWSQKKRGEKLNYIHLNPVKRGLVEKPEQWKWSSYRYYAFGELGPVLINEQVPARMTVRKLKSV